MLLIVGAHGTAGWAVACLDSHFSQDMISELWCIHLSSLA
jgi:hypothetical protein